MGEQRSVQPVLLLLPLLLARLSQLWAFPFSPSLDLDVTPRTTVFSKGEGGGGGTETFPLSLRTQGHCVNQCDSVYYENCTRKTTFPILVASVQTRASALTSVSLFDAAAAPSSSPPPPKEVAQILKLAPKTAPLCSELLIVSLKSCPRSHGSANTSNETMDRRSLSDLSSVHLISVRAEKTAEHVFFGHWVFTQTYNQHLCVPPPWPHPLTFARPPLLPPAPHHCGRGDHCSCSEEGTPAPAPPSVSTPPLRSSEDEYY